MSVRAFIALVALTASGCQLFYDLDEETFVPADATSIDVRTADVDGSTPTDTSVPDVSAPDLLDISDTSDASADLGPSGLVCPNPAPLGGSCNLVLQDCSPDQICEVGLLMPGVETGCRTRAMATNYVLGLADACTPAGTQRCAPGLLCRESVCVRYCYTDSALGCATDEFCAALDATNLPGVGWCTAGCP